MERRPSVLFLCTQNAGRSQMAAALLERAAGDRIEVRSGGSAPAEEVHPTVHAAMREIAVDLTPRKPKGFTIADIEAADVVVTMGCGDSCPVVPGKIYEEWALPDPATMSIDEVRDLRDDLSDRVDVLVRRLTATPTR